MMRKAGTRAARFCFETSAIGDVGIDINSAHTHIYIYV